MSSLPPSFTNGNILDASELNLIRAARNGDFTPIDPGTNNELDNAYSIGTPSVRWLNGNFSGQINADGQTRIKAFAPSQGVLFNGGNGSSITFNAPIVDIGDITFTAPDIFTLNSGGLYLVHFHSIDTGTGGFGSNSIELHRPLNTVIENWINDYSQVDPTTEAQVQGIVFANSLDIIKIKSVPPPTGSNFIPPTKLTIYKLP